MEKKVAHNNQEKCSVDSSAPVVQALDGIDFPTDRQGLRDYAEQHGACEEVLSEIEQMPKQEYRSIVDVLEALAKKETARNIAKVLSLRRYPFVLEHARESIYSEYPPALPSIIATSSQR